MVTMSDAIEKPLTKLTAAPRRAADRGEYRETAGVVRSKRSDRLRLPLPAPAEKADCAEAGGEQLDRHRATSRCNEREPAALTTRLVRLGSRPGGHNGEP